MTSPTWWVSFGADKPLFEAVVRAPVPADAIALARVLPDAPELLPALAADAVQVSPDLVVPDRYLGRWLSADDGDEIRRELDRQIVP